jgi:C1A family cysteine protease
MKLPIQNKLPGIIDLRPKMPPVYDQGNLGSCTAQAFCGLIGYVQPSFNGSRLFLYYCERELQKTISIDSGATLFDGIKSLQKNGVCLERLWPYIISKFAVKPPDNCFKDALNHQALKVRNINSSSLTAMKNCLVCGLSQNPPIGLPFTIGFQVYESFESIQVSRNGIVPMPKPGEQVLGGHAVCVVGYDDSKGYFIVRNSWGSRWGIKGYFYIPYAYLTNPKLATDAWTITLME